jgi:DNA-binding IclR family transcriptional regulator
MARGRQAVARKGSSQRQRRTRGTTGKDEHASIETVDRAARILFALAASPRQSTLVEIAARTRLSKPTAFRILATLVADGLAVQNEQTAAYMLGVVPLQLASAVLRDIPIRDRARPVMQAISDRVHETVVLSVRQEDFRFNIDSFEAMNAIGQTQKIGIGIPLYAGAASRVLLACLSDVEIEDYLRRTALVAYSETTLVDPEKLRQEIARIRTDGYAISSAEFTPGGHAVACAITDADNRPVAALHVSIPRSRAAPELLENCIEQLKLGTDALRRAFA